jgi:hypothetical protein
MSEAGRPPPQSQRHAGEGLGVGRGVQHSDGPPAEKCCGSCKQTKPLSAFWRSRDRSDGYATACAACGHAQKLRYRKTAKYQATQAAYLARPEVKARNTANTAKYRATPEGRKATAASHRRYRATAHGKAVSAAAGRRYRATPKGKAAIAAQHAKRRATGDPAVCKAAHRVQRAVRLGILVRKGICKGCGATGKTHLHHYRGYDRKQALMVRELCRTCHWSAHKSVGEE